MEFIASFSWTPGMQNSCSLCCTWKMKLASSWWDTSSKARRSEYGSLVDGSFSKSTCGWKVKGFQILGICFAIASNWTFLVLGTRLMKWYALRLWSQIMRYGDLQKMPLPSVNNILWISSTRQHRTMTQCEHRPSFRYYNERHRRKHGGGSII